MTLKAFAPYQLRVIKEKAKLDLRLGRLRAFISSPLIEGVDAAERSRLSEQEDLMTRLSNVMGRRIESFSEGKPGIVALAQPSKNVLLLAFVGKIIWTSAHDHLERDALVEVLADEVMFYGAFSLAGDALEEVRLDSLRQYLLDVVPYEEQKHHMEPKLGTNYVLCVAKKVQ